MQLNVKWTLGKKIGGLAAILLTLLGAVSLHFFFEVKEIGRELEEMVVADYPLYTLAGEIKHCHDEQRRILERILRLSQVQGRDRQHLQREIATFKQLNVRMNDGMQQGQSLAKRAAQDERRKEGNFRLNQEQEDYLYVHLLFIQVQQEHHQFQAWATEAINLAISGNPQAASSLQEQSQDAGNDITPLVRQIVARLQGHVRGSLAATEKEEFRALTTNSAISFTAVITGIVLSGLVMRQLTRPVNEMTKKARQIAASIARDTWQGEKLEIKSTDEIGDLGMAFNQVVDNFVTSQRERQRIEQVLFQEKELAQVTLQSIGDAVITTDAMGLITSLNPVAETLTGWSQHLAQGCKLTTIFKITDEATHHPVAPTLREHWRLTSRAATLSNPLVLHRRGGERIPIQASTAPIRANNNKTMGMVIVFHDITQEREAAQQLEWHASHDHLTGLKNRREFEHQLIQTLHTVCNLSSEHFLIYLDLDHFKIINDTCGHFAGDELLRQVAKLLKTYVRPTDTVARLGGDEFALILNVDSQDQALQIANRLFESIQDMQFVWQHQLFTIGVSMGIVPFQQQHHTSIDLMKAADAACYAAKNRGRNQIYLLKEDDVELSQQAHEMKWLSRIKQAIATDQFQLFYQTISPLKSAQQQGECYEVLLRLKDVNGNMISPMAFIPIAERYELMGAIDRWVITTLFSNQSSYYQSRWRDTQIHGDNHHYLYTINLSGQTLSDSSFIDFLQQQFMCYQVPPQLICFEITETVAIANLSITKHLITQLKQLGCHFALDDFGSGMSSFAYLKTLPVDYLKIDGLFIKDLLSDPINSTLIQAMNQVAHAMGIQSIAEFVEDDATLEVLKSLDVDYVQGYGIARPAPLPLQHQERSSPGAIIASL